MATSYSLPKTIAEAGRVSAKLNNAVYKASTLLAIHELSLWVAWQADAYAELPKTAAGKDFAEQAIGKSAGHVSKLRGILTLTSHGVVAPFLARLAAADTDSIVPVVVEMVDAIDSAARADEASKCYGKGANTVDAMYSYLGIGSSGGDVTWEGTGLSSAKKAKKAGVTKAAWLKRMSELADDVWSA